MYQKTSLKSTKKGEIFMFNNQTQFVFSDEFVGFTTVPNYVFNDENISYKAQGIYCQILQFQNSPSHKIYLKTLVGRKTDGRDSVSSGLKELIEAGYLAKEQIRNEKGQLDGVKYTVYMKPRKPHDIRVFTENGKPVLGESDFGKPVTNNKISKKKIIKNKNTTTTETNVTKKDTSSKKQKAKDVVVVDKHIENETVKEIQTQSKENGISLTKKNVVELIAIANGDIEQVRNGILAAVEYAKKTEVKDMWGLIYSAVKDGRMPALKSNQNTNSARDKAYYDRIYMN